MFTFYNFWDYVLNLVFLATAGLLLLPFGILAWSLWVTWQENAHKVAKRTKRDIL